jgi:RNA polymerase sigma-70 factor, ECF subfamily
MANRTPHSERLTQWVSEHARAVHGYLMALLRDAHAADDLTQEVFCRAWESRQRYSEQGKPRAYLLRIADRLVCDRARRAGHRERPIDGTGWEKIEPSSVDRSPLAELLAAENRRQLAAALDMLSEPQRRTLLLRYFGDLDFDEIARILECPTNTALSHARRALEALRRTLVEKAE